MKREAAGDGQDPVAQALGLGGGQLAGEQQPLGPDDEVMGEAYDLKPPLVGGEVAKRQVAQAGVFVVADVVLDVCAAAVIALNGGGRAGLVGEDRLEAMTVMVGEGELRVRMRALTPDDDPRPVGPALEVEVLGDL